MIQSRQQLVRLFNICVSEHESYFCFEKHRGADFKQAIYDCFDALLRLLLTDVQQCRSLKLVKYLLIHAECVSHSVKVCIVFLHSGEELLDQLVLVLLCRDT